VIIMKRFCLIIIIGLIIYSNGCLSNNSSEIKTGGANELNLSISLEDSLYTNKSTSMNVTISLKNIYSEPVLVEERFDLGSNIVVYMISPQNETLKVHVPSSTHIKEKINLKPNNEKKFSFNLIDKYIVYENMTNYAWNEKGIYTIYAEYTSYSGDIISSNHLNFEYK